MHLAQDVEVPEVGLDGQFHLIHQLRLFHGILFHHLHLRDFRGGVDGLELDVAHAPSGKASPHRHDFVDRHGHIDTGTCQTGGQTY